MKQTFISFVLALLPLMVSADAVEIGGIWYNLVSKTKQAEVTEMPSGSYSGAIEISDKVPYNGSVYSVTSIGDYAFSSCSELISVTIPNSVTSIGDYAFDDCTSLTSIEIPNSVTSIGWNAFSGCTGLTSVTIPNSVTSIGEEAFSGCFNLTSVHITDLESWCKIAFGSYNSNPLSCAHHFFFNGEEIKDLVIPNSVTSIGREAFSGCSGLTSVTISNSVTSIGYRAFEDCTGLTSITIPNSVTSIGGRAFLSCTGLTSVTVPNSVTNIGNYAFDGCSGLTSVTLPNNVTSIGWNAFSGCTGLTSVTIPNNVTSIGSDAFYGCSGLTTITIGNGVKFIDKNAFVQCPELTDVYCLAEELSSTDNWGDGSLYTDNSAFDGSYIKAATLHVPESAINAYQTTAPWNGFGKYVTLSGENIPKCATPTISLVDGEIVFGCETEGVSYISEVTSSDIQKFYDDKLKLTYKYKVTVYATKDGYENSDTATREIVLTENGKTVLDGDVDGNGVVNVADHVELTKIIMTP